MWHYFFIVILVKIQSIYSIINGLQAHPDQFPAMTSAFIFFNDAGKRGQLCGGTLIGPSVLLTAAHCLWDDKKIAKSARITVGDYRLEQKDAEEQRHFVSQASFVINPAYLTNGTEDEDFALIILSQKLGFCEYWKPRITSLPPAKEWLQGNHILSQVGRITDAQIESANCFATGWGVTSTSDHSNAAQYMPISLSTDRKIGYDTLIGRANKSSMSICDGDSGSPVYCTIDSKNYLIGILVEQISENSHENIGSTAAEQCAQYDRFVVLDLRYQFGKIQQLLSTRRLDDEILSGQRLCGHV